MYSILLLIIYISFISLGLPDALLGCAWPSMYGPMDVPVSYAGIVSMLIAAGTIVSSLCSDRCNRRFGTGKVTAVSVAMTAVALLGFSFSHAFWMLCLWAIPYGLGAGAVDAALNNYVALHYESKHMSWLHCFWGIGAALGPYIMGFYLTNGANWNRGYQSIGILQVVLTAILFFSLPLWKKEKEEQNSEKSEKKAVALPALLKIAGVKEVLTAFFCYCALESTAGLWASSFLVLYGGIGAETAAKWASLFYMGITVGRLFGGFMTMKLSDRQLIRLGQGVIGIGLLLLFLPMWDGFLLMGLILIGLGCAPIYPSIIHATPENFGKELSQAVIGVQMAFAYLGSCFMPPLFGFLADYVSIRWYPAYLLILAAVMLIMTEKLTKAVQKKTVSN